MLDPLKLSVVTECIVDGMLNIPPTYEADPFMLKKKLRVNFSRQRKTIGK